MTRGASLEAMIRRSAEIQGLRGLKQTGPRYVGATGRGGRAKGGRVVGKGELDFAGNVGPLAVTFDAKSCANGTSFPLANIKRHQATICKRRHEEGAIAFFLVEFSALDAPEYFALTWPVLEPYWKRYDAIKPGADYVASIPLTEFRGQCIRVERAGSVLDLLAAVKQLTEGGAA